MKLTFEQVMERANEHYRAAKGKKKDLRYTAPEAMPVIYSDQVQSLAKAIVELINEQEAST